MIESWQHWQGQVVDGAFPLSQYLGGSENSAVFLTEYGERHLKAAIRLVAADSQNTERQLSRWRLAQKLSHPHLVRLLRLGSCEVSNTAVLYVLMEYAEENLSQVLPERPLTIAEAREMLEPTLGALAYLHGEGFVHGHLKPTNFMVVDDQLKISSDGICRIGESGSLAKPSIYDPPEVASEGISPAGDVWSLGVILVEALTQRLPVEVDQREPTLPEGLPAPFLDIVRHSLQPAPQSRWTVADIALGLGQKNPESSRQATPRMARYMVPAAALALALLAMVAGPRLRRSADGSAASTATPAISRPDQGATEVARGSSVGVAPPMPEARVSVGSIIPVEVVRQVLPTVPEKARNTIRGRVKVGLRVRVDPSGQVVDAQLDSPGPSKYFSELAAQAARQWKFVPPKIDGRPVSSEWLLRFTFVRTGISVVPVRVRSPR